MSTETFPRFGELPKELQIHLWKYAVSPHGQLSPSEDFFDRIFRVDVAPDFFHVTSPEGPTGYVMGYCIPSIKENCRTTDHAGVDLKGTWRLSRLIVLETWRRVIAPIDPWWTTDATSEDFGVVIDSNEWFHRDKAVTLELLDGLIG